MDNDAIKTYTMRISQANKTELVVITYDIILDDIAAACRAIDENCRDTLRRETSHAVRFVAELMSALNLTVPLSGQLWRLYEYVQKQLIAAGYSADRNELEAASEVILGLREAFAEISKMDTSESVMGNVQPVFAGLTYSRGRLNEVNLDPNQATRGFLA